MSDSMFFPSEGYRERGKKGLDLVVTFGATSVASSTGTGGTVTRTGAGLYTLTLDDSFIAFRGMPWVIAANGAASDLVVQIDAVSMTAKTITFRTLAAAVATDPASGTVLYLSPQFKDCSV